MRRIQFRQGVVVVFCRTVYVDISSLRRLKCYRASTVAEAEYGSVGFLQRKTRLKGHRFSDKRRSNYRHTYRKANTGACMATGMRINIAMIAMCFDVVRVKMF